MNLQTQIKLVKEKIILEDIIEPVMKHCQIRYSCKPLDDNDYEICPYYDICHTYFIEENPSDYTAEEMNEVLDNFMNGV